MTEGVTDRRVRRSRAALRAAMVDLVSDREYEKITVADVLLRADVARGTFYSHYADRDALFGDAVAHLTEQLVGDVAAVAARGTARLTGLGVRVLFEHARQHRDLYLAMIHGAAGGVPLDSYVNQLTTAYSALMTESIAVVGVTPRMPLEAIARCWVGETIALTTWWLQESPDLGIDDVTRMRMHLMTGGTTWAVGLEPGQLSFVDSLPTQ